jgi:glucose/arabinose dehydrogenase
MTFDTAGNLLVVEVGKGISVHSFNHDGCIGSSKQLISMQYLTHGIAFSLDGKTLYASTMTTVYSWPYDAISQSVRGDGSIAIGGMYPGGHITRTLTFAPHKPNLLLVSHGSNDNIDYASIDPAVGRSMIRVFDMNNVPIGGYIYRSDGYLMGYGLRNEVGLIFDGNNM